MFFLLTGMVEPMLVGAARERLARVRGSRLAGVFRQAGDRSQLSGKRRQIDVREDDPGHGIDVVHALLSVLHRRERAPYGALPEQGSSGEV
jgi:hypothetical protein